MCQNPGMEPVGMIPLLTQIVQITSICIVRVQAGGQVSRGPGLALPVPPGRGEQGGQLQVYTDLPTYQPPSLQGYFGSSCRLTCFLLFPVN